MTTPQTYEFSGTMADAYEQYFVPTIPAPLASDLLATVTIDPGERVLDVACGTGIVARLVADKVGSAGHVAGTDASAEMLELADSLSTASGSPIEWRQASAEQQPFPDDSFDVVLCQLGLMLVPDRAGAVAEMRRVLVDGGRVGIVTPGEIHPINEIFADALAEHINPELGGFLGGVFSLHDPDELAGLLTDAGFADVKGWETEKTLRLPPPADYLWQYIQATPLGIFVGEAPEEAHAALEADVVERWQPFCEGEGMSCDQKFVFATARA